MRGGIHVSAYMHVNVPHDIVESVVDICNSKPRRIAV